MTRSSVKQRKSFRTILAGGLLVLAGLTACDESGFLDALYTLAYLMETPAPQEGMVVGSGG
jgi:hypothetical protein